ncbi:MAG: SDR family NAD(P)-dependent oxidoreductase [Planctomycetota bacterium]|jgi:acyl transferase domain-containing protein/thioesterase domain-containing protein/acyl carrier protein|nr:SDR family NAD(P)-dependent oxidoreductase [Planctomycetota bacterium]MDP6761668.1 SDR family NAD(P)-dependent oxidoreductase [Planctomycetota bacterium]MDP6990626.1 SDR family NAD(P)-dependent oxidoreductase [Planctomycetota bacterium]
MPQTPSHPSAENDVAIVGMALRVPGADDLEQFWKNLRGGVESVQSLSEEQLLAAGVTAEELAQPNYVRRCAPLSRLAEFDPEFFGFSPKEAAILDPQHRHFLECTWEALEDAAHPPSGFEGPIGVFAGCGMGGYFMFHLLTNPELVRSVGLFLLRHTGNDKDFLATRASYVFDLKGPSISVQTACSTSLVAVHTAAQSLLTGECDMALAGGVTIEIPHGRGYVYTEGEILSPDGRCRPFDHRSQGTVFGSGVGVVALRRLDEAVADGDRIYAVIKGSAVNNDGAGKIGYLAPSVDGQAQAVAEALAVADVSAETIGLVECHGTGTPMGDPIEIAALTTAFRESSACVGTCAIGSVKSNIGHLDTAAGIASLIKASLALHHREIPPSLNFEAPNPDIDFERSPFWVNARLREWSAGPHPRRAGVNSLGVGGTNAHVILEEAPVPQPCASAARRHELLCLSASSKPALDDAAQRLGEHLEAHPEQELADVAFTLREGRRAFEHRRVLACADHGEAARLLASGDPRRVFTHRRSRSRGSVAFLFPGGGAQHPGMGRDLFETEPLFREEVERGFGELLERTGVDLFELLYRCELDEEEVRRRLVRPSLQLPALFVVEAALARLWMERGLEPTAMIGHSMGENTAAHIAGVMSYGDTLGLVELRGRLFERVPEGGMLSVSVPSDELAAMLGEDLDLATINAPANCVASGSSEALDALERKLEAAEVDARRVQIAIAAHSRLVDPILEEFGEYLRGIELSPPRIPFVSNLTGTWINDEEAVDPDYWVRHLRGTVRFADGIGALLEDPARVLLEVGPGNTLTSLARQHDSAGPERCVLSSMRHPQEQIADDAYLLTTQGRLWAVGVEEMPALDQREQRRRVSLPSYPFQHQPYWIEAREPAFEDAAQAASVTRLEDFDEWFRRPVWRECEAPSPAEPAEPQTWLVFLDDGGLGAAICERLTGRGDTVVEVRVGDGYARLSDSAYLLTPEHGRAGYDRLVADVVASGRTPSRIAHLWSVTADESFRPGSNFFHRTQESGFYSLFFLAQALGESGLTGGLHLDVFSNGMQQVADEPLPYPEKATLLGPCGVLPRELTGVTCASIDLDPPPPPARGLFARKREPVDPAGLVAAIEEEIAVPPGNRTLARRDGRRWELAHEKAVGPSGRGEPGLREGSVVLITGGLGGLGLAMAEHLVRTCGARLALLGRKELPPRQEWAARARGGRAADAVGRTLGRLLEIEDLGGEVLTLAADVTDQEAMREALAAVRRRFGRLDGVIHLAGVIDDQLLSLKTQGEVERVFAPKVHGTLVLDRLLARERLDFFVVSSSTSVVTSPVGQVDYVAANAFLNAYAHSRSGRRGRHTVAIGWGIWKDVGMAAAAIAAPARPPEEPVPLGSPHPLLDGRARDEHGHTVLSAEYGTDTHWVLDEHRTAAGHALLPGTGFIELARAALDECGERGPFELCDLYFFRALEVGDGATRSVRVRLIPDELGYAIEVQSAHVLDDGRRGWETHAQARCALGDLEPPDSVPLDEIDRRCRLSRSPVDESGLRTAQEDHLRFGPRWRVLHQACYGEGEALGLLELHPEVAADLEEYPLHPALLDIGTGFAMDLIDGYEYGTNLWVPVSYERLRFFAPLSRTLRSWVRIRADATGPEGFARFDVTLCNLAGAVLVEVEGLLLKRLEESADFAHSAPPDAAQLELEQAEAGVAAPLSPAEHALRENLALGILPQEGVRALDAVLATPGQAEVIVSSIDLDQLGRQVDALAAGGDEEQTRFARPALENEFVEPRDEIERTLVGFWEELLGVDEVGVRDSFFDLGGHSLIAVRLFARIKRAYDAEFPISLLFEAPTVEACAEHVRARIGAGERAGDDEPRARFAHLVPMHEGEPGKRTPFFLVAGMFGNVLNLRHLAHLIGEERPFYGLQARGVYGGHEPHDDFEEMARAYIGEMRAVQPAGPYLLGGFSGGGITAYEIARQLREAGEEVALLVLLDTPLPQAEPLSLRDKLMLHIQRLRREGAGYVTSWVNERIEWERAQRAAGTNGVAPAPAYPMAFDNDGVEAAFRKALTRYRVRPCGGAITLFRPRLENAYAVGGGRYLTAGRDFVYHDNGWGPHAPRVDVHEVPGDHDSMVLEPNVRALAARLQACIAAAQDGHAREP